MTLLTLNGAPIVSGSIQMPRIGVLSGEVCVDTEQPVTNPLTLTTDDGSFTLKCSIHPGRNAEFLQTLRIHFVGGSGGLCNPTSDQTIKPRAYRGYTVRTILTDILKDCGETLSPDADQKLLNLFVNQWSRLGGTAKNAVHTLLSFKGCESWRILGDGTFWATLDEPWPPVANEDFEVISRNTSENWCLIASERPFALPGQALALPSEAAGSANPIQHISAVVHSFEPGLVQSLLYFEDV
jgi:hypothetical protein